MDLSSLIDSLARPAAWPLPVEQVEVKQTHLSAVFLAGGLVFKVKKPLNLGFADFSTLDRRRFFCEQEVVLNRRLAPSVYLGVLPVTRGPEGLRFEGEGEPVEWAVKMRRLPEEATLTSVLQAGQVHEPQIALLAERIASFHQAASLAPSAFRQSAAETVARNARENFEQSRSLVGLTVPESVYHRLRELTEGSLHQLQPLLNQRASQGLVRDTHGDLRTDHVYLFPEKPPPDDLVVIDCIEFNERFRYADPVADVAFLVMDLCFQGRPDLARLLAGHYFTATGDDEGAQLLPFYAAYRAVVRGKVEGMELSETEVPSAERSFALENARRHWLLALTLLDRPGQVPCLVLVGGLPGSGKSTLSRDLTTAGFEVIRSDVVRKQLFPSREERYSPENMDQTYQECLRLAEAMLLQGRRVIVDATFRRDAHRQLFIAAARRWLVPALILFCAADPLVIKERLNRRNGDASDADWAIYQRHVGEWEPPGPETAGACRTVRTDGVEGQGRAEALELIAEKIARHTLRGL